MFIHFLNAFEEMYVGKVQDNVFSFPEEYHTLLEMEILLVLSNYFSIFVSISFSATSFLCNFGYAI